MEGTGGGRIHRGRHVSDPLDVVSHNPHHNFASRHLRHSTPPHVRLAITARTTYTTRPDPRRNLDICITHHSFATAATEMRIEMKLAYIEYKSMGNAMGSTGGRTR